jgi:murein DD-endopeptidase MepM/ murein hydrolase activator NlpD
MNKLLLLTAFLVCAACGESDSTPAPSSPSEHGPALLVLPFPVGRSYVCQMGFNDPASHIGLFRNSVDFSMPIGTTVTAARTGRVVYVEQRYADDDRTSGHENVVIVLHQDSTYSRYVHLTRNGALVEAGRELSAGDTVGLSGNSGSTAAPHLHFDVVRDAGQRDVPTLPFAFRNNSPPAAILEKGVRYTALPY